MMVMQSGGNDNGSSSRDGLSVSAPIDQARRYVAAGLSVFPVKTNGTKEPAFAGWREYAMRKPTPAELRSWFADPRRHGIGIAGGEASGNLAVFDFETLDSFQRWGVALDENERAALAGSPVIRTPKGGRHVYVRTAEPVKGCKLARTPAGVTLIEVRGRQHYVVAPGSPPPVHPLGVPYTVARDGWLNGRPHPLMPMPRMKWSGTGRPVLATGRATTSTTESSGTTSSPRTGGRSTELHRARPTGAAPASHPLG